ncbi:hypothetical protein GOP47_0004565 [Adiantum capillus-veneris]|uniref:Uncharacterized protein n=1 Tax=Adiantum capillus-veneris TaxID=13818 RepID=A0A9D4ZPP7_ADICA|nr:hypothetical protein GOP47_0004565 [Adiantum capillus-veneris]
MRGSEIVEEEKKRDHWSPRHQHRRSCSWSGSPCLPPELLRKAESADPDAEKLSLAPISISSTPPPPNRERTRLINRIRHGPGMKLNLDVVRRDSDGNEASGDAELRLRKERLAVCDKECSCIFPYLFLSGRSVAQNLNTLQDSRITHIINCVGFFCPEYFPNDFAYRTLWLQDSQSEDIMCILYDVFDMIENVREQRGGRVLLHCCQGVSRSAALIIAYLMWRKNESFEDAFYEVKSKRNVVSPNMGFLSQLMQWQKRISSPIDREALQIYRIAPQSPYDPLYLVPKYTGPGGIELLDSRGAFLIRFANMLYVWKGRHCDKDMVAVADHAAFQFVRYERAQGPCLFVKEGSELRGFPKVWAVVLESSKPEADEGQLSLYESDYEMYRKAKAGTYVPPVIGSGVPINLPARDETWRQLHGSPTKING